jgi:hypothetical protein
MFAGHLGVALAARPVAPRASLGVLVLAAQWVDLVWPVLLLLGLEHVRIAPGVTEVTPLEFVHYPITHSLLTGLLWGALLGGVYARATRDRRGALLVAILVVSHWVLDFVTHRPDLPLWPGGPKVGLGLWNSLPATALVEMAILFAGVWLYIRATGGARRRWPLGLFAGFLVVVQVANYFGPPPPSITAIAVVGLAQWLLPPWAAAEAASRRWLGFECNAEYLATSLFRFAADKLSDAEAVLTFRKLVERPQGAMRIQKLQGLLVL